MARVSEELRDELRSLATRMAQTHGASEAIRELLDRAMWTEYQLHVHADDHPNVITPHDEASFLGRLIDRLNAKRERLNAEVY
jgi:hypothetical protein